MNKVFLFGRLGADPEIRHIPSGDAVANFNVATSFRYKDKQTGDWKEKPEWHRVTAWRRTAEIAGEYLRTGSQVLIEGRIETEKYEKDGSTRYATKIICEKLTLVGGRQDSSGASSAPSSKPAPPEEFDDEVPF